MTERTLRDKVKRLQELQAEIDFLEGKAETLKDHIKQEMSARQTDELQAGNAMVRWKYIRANRFDSKTFREHHADLYGQYTQESESRRFTIVTA